MKEALSQAEVNFAYVDITSSMLPLSQFLKLRDNHPDFAPIREVGRVGLPCVYVTGDGVDTVYFKLPEDLGGLK